MPWDAESFKKHNHGLNTALAGHAARQANAILEKTNDEGLAIAVANRDARKYGGPKKVEKRNGT